MFQEEFPPGAQEHSWKGRVFMKRLLAYFTALSIFLLAGCVSNLQNSSTEPFSPPPDATIDYNQFMNWSGSWTATDSGYYILADNPGVSDISYLKYLYFMDTNCNLTPLCGRPECDHLNKSCDALIDTSNIFYHNGSLYYLYTEEMGKRGIYQMSLTGQNRHLVRKLDFLNASDSYGIAAGKCGPYLVVTYDAPDIEEGNNRTIYLVSLDSNEPPIPIFKGVNGEEDIRYEIFKKAYPWVLAIKNEETERGHELWGYNIETQEYRLIMDNWRFGELGDLYASETEIDWFVMGDGFYRLDLKTGETTKLRDADPVVEQGAGVYDEQYIYLNNDTPGSAKTGTVPPEQLGLHIYDRDTKEIAFLSTDGIDFHLSYAFTTADRVFFFNFSTLNLIPYYYIEKDKIPTGELQWMPIEAGMEQSRPTVPD